jgi:hypothetical protein
LQFKFSLAQLFLGITVWSVCLGAIVASLPSWVYVLLAVGTVIAIAFLFARLKNLAGIALLSFPIFCLLHWSLFVVGLDYVFGGSGVGKPVGPIAHYLSQPVVILQNSIPLAGLWDTYLGIALIASIETGTLILAKYVRRQYATPNPASVAS